MKIAFFDFDGTITTKDTFVEIIRFHHGSFKCYAGFLLLSPYIFAFKARLISNQRAKERVLKFFFGGYTRERFEEICRSFANGRLPELLRPKALKEIQSLQQKNIEVVVVSASPAEWIRPWANTLGITVLSSSLFLENDKITGRLQGKNCHGREKVQRIEAAYTLSQYSDIYAYGDSSGDKEMLAMADYAFFKPFR